MGIFVHSLKNVFSILILVFFIRYKVKKFVWCGQNLRKRFMWDPHI
jgi:hypothetical protein